jgi:hypothetical protein
MLIKKTAPLLAALAAGGIAVAMAQASTPHTTASGLTRHVVTHTVKSDGRVGTREGTAHCPTGSSVTGGGYDAQYGGTQVTVNDRPSSNGWYVKVLGTGSITIYAVCMS